MRGNEEGDTTEARLRCILETVPDAIVTIDEQVVLNLVRNAIEAMAGSAERLLTIRTSLLTDVEVSVSDTGGGLAAAVRDQLFQPFVSTRPAGIGVGLSICRSIVETHGGHIRVEANRQGGTTSAFTLPLSRNDSETGTAHAADRAHRG